MGKSISHRGHPVKRTTRAGRETQKCIMVVVEPYKASDHSVESVFRKLGFVEKEIELDDENAFNKEYFEGDEEEL